MASGPRNQREIIARFEGLREELQNLGDSLSERRNNAQVSWCPCAGRQTLAATPLGQARSLQEHGLVCKTLQPLDKKRKCFRQIGDVLVERTVGDVLPDVQTNKEQLDQVHTTDCACLYCAPSL